MELFQHNSKNLAELTDLVDRNILKLAKTGMCRRTLTPKTNIPFDPSKIWIVENGSVVLEHRAKPILELKTNSLMGPWLGAVAPLSLVTCEEECQLVGFEQDVVAQVVLSDGDKMKLWCEFQSLSAAFFFSEFANLKALYATPVPKYRSFGPGEVILREGERGEEILLLTKGALDVLVNGQRVGRIKQDEVFGVLAAMTEGVRTATVVATTFSECMAFSRGDFQDLLRTNGQLMEKLFEDFARALSDSNVSVIRANKTHWKNLFDSGRPLI